MNVLVLGGNGFIGSHVVDALLESGHRVKIFGRGEDPYRGRLPDVDYVTGNFTDSVVVSEALEGVDAVFHGISTTLPSTSNSSPVEDIQSNLVATVRLVQLMLEKGIRRLVFLSSGGTVYGNTDVDLISETEPLNPICSYGVVKVAIENYLFMFQQLSELSPIVLRVSNPYGERQGHLGVQGIIGTFLRRLQRGESIEVWGDGTTIRDFVYVRDLAMVCRTALESRVTGVYNIGSGQGYSVNDIIRCLAEVTGWKGTPVHRSSRRFDVKKVVLDISKARSQLGWEPTTSLSEGLARTWQWLSTTSRRQSNSSFTVGR